jgi:hypothetical protein
MNENIKKSRWFTFYNSNISETKLQMLNSWLGHEICLDYVFIVCSRSWGWNNSIKNN